MADLPVCRMFRRAIDVYTSFSPRSGKAEFVQFFQFYLIIVMVTACIFVPTNMYSMQ